MRSFFQKNQRNPGRKTLAGLMAGSNSARSALSMAAGLMVAGILGPAQMGLVATARLYADYGPVVGLGAPNGMLQRVPVLRGRGSHADAKLCQDAVFSYVLFTSLLVLTAAVPLALTGLIPPWILWGAASLIVLNLLNQFWSTVAVQNRRFVLLAGCAIALGVMSVVTVPLAFFDYRGGITRLVAVALVEAVILMSIVGIHLRPRIAIGDVRRCIAIGWPVLLMAFMTTYAAVLDKTLIKITLGTKALGLYAIASTIVINSAVIQQAVARVLQPDVGEQLGRSGSAKEAATKVLRAFPGVAALATVLAVAGGVAVPHFVHWFLPAYEESIGACQVACAVFGFRCMNYSGFFFSLCRRNGPAIILQAVALGIQLLLSLFFHNRGMGLMSFPLGLLAGTIVYTCGSNLLIFAISRGRISWTVTLS